MLTRFIIRALCIAALIFGGLVPAFGYDETQLAIAEKEVSAFRSDIERIQGVVIQPGVTDEQLVEQKRLLETIRVDGLGFATKLNDPLNEITQQLAQLGPPPAEGATETAAISAERANLTALAAKIAAAQKQMELVALEAEQLASKVSTLQRTAFFQRIFNAGKSVLNPQFWVDTFAGVDLLTKRVASLIAGWWQVQASNTNYFGLLLLPSVVAAIWMLNRFLGITFLGWLPSKKPDLTEVRPQNRLWRVVWGSIGVFVIGVCLAILAGASLQLANMWSPRIEPIFSVIGETLIPTAFQTALAWFVCAPRRPNWRLINIDEKTASRLPILVFAATFIHTGAKSLGALSDKLYLPVGLSIGQSAIAAAIMILLIAAALRMLKQQSVAAHDTGNRPVYLAWFVSLIPFIWILLAVATLSILLGYIALGYFIVGQILDTTLLAAFLFLIHHWVDALSDTIHEPFSKVGNALRRFAGFGEKGLKRFGLLFRTLTDVVLVLVGIPSLLALWTVTWVDFQSLINTAVLGIKIGSFSISPFTILTIIGLFIAGIVLTRFITRWLDTRVLSQTTMNRGVQDSVRTGANYVGYILTAAFALSAAGIDFSNMAIIAGALGVGIGFGLQSIVNNFVSGLILLAERPVRVGDWVVTAAGEGIIKKINVRSTEIETFDSCTIIVPNSNLITEPVRNWMHRDTSGRFLVSVNVAYGTDVDLVTEVLQDILKRHPKVLRYPAPLVQLAKFGTIAMEFEVRALVSDIFEGAEVASQLRLAIVKEFAAKSIVIPAATEFAKLK